MKIQASQPELENVDALWDLLKEGDNAGLEGIYRYFSKSLFRYGLSMVADHDFVQDCIQEVFIDLWKYHRNLQKAENVKLYLFRSLSRKISRESKKENKWKKEQRMALIESCYFSDSKESELIHLQKEELLQRKLAKAVKELPLRQKEVIQYLFFESFSYEETAGLMGINLRSVYTLAWKAISNLKKSILSIVMFWGIFH